MQKKTNQARRGLLVAAIVIGAAALAATAPKVSEWIMGGFDIENSRYQPRETTLNKTNVAQLLPKWTYHAGGSITSTPAVEGGAVYVVDWKTPGLSDDGGKLYKVDAQTGLEVWSNPISMYTGIPGDFSRGTPAVTGDNLILGNQAGRFLTFAGINAPAAQVFAVNKESGALVWSTSVHDHPAGIVTQAPMVYDGVVYVGVASNDEAFAGLLQDYECCNFRGKMLALDASNGDILWETYTVPEGYSGGAIWGSSPVFDTKRDTVYVTTGNNYSLPDDVQNCVIQAIQNGDPDSVIAACDSDDNWFDSVLALDAADGSVKWGRRFLPYDTWTVSCFGVLPPPFPPLNGKNCPEEAGPDFDFGQGPALFDNTLGVGQKSGDYWGLNPNTGEILWNTQVAPGDISGGLQWGSATDGERIYTGASNFPNFAPWKLSDGTMTDGRGFWAAIDGETGDIVWETVAPIFSSAQGAVSTANGVIYAGLMGNAFQPNTGEPTMFALDAASGAVLWQFPSGGSVIGAPAIADGVVYWGSGAEAGGGAFGDQPDNKLYAFTVNGN